MAAGRPRMRRRLVAMAPPILGKTTVPAGWTFAPRRRAVSSSTVCTVRTTWRAFSGRLMSLTLQKRIGRSPCPCSSRGKPLPPAQRGDLVEAPRAPARGRAAEATGERQAEDRLLEQRRTLAARSDQRREARGEQARLGAGIAEAPPGEAAPELRLASLGARELVTPGAKPHGRAPRCAPARSATAAGRPAPRARRGSGWPPSTPPAGSARRTIAGSTRRRNGCSAGSCGTMATMASLWKRAARGDRHLSQGELEAQEQRPRRVGTRPRYSSCVGRARGDPPARWCARAPSALLAVGVGEIGDGDARVRAVRGRPSPRLHMSGVWVGGVFPRRQLRELAPSGTPGPRPARRFRARHQATTDRASSAIEPAQLRCARSSPSGLGERTKAARSSACSSAVQPRRWSRRASAIRRPAASPGPRAPPAHWPPSPRRGSVTSRSQPRAATSCSRVTFQACSVCTRASHQAATGASSAGGQRMGPRVAACRRAASPARARRTTRRGSARPW